VISFLGAKTLRQTQDKHFSPEEKVNFRKRKKIIKTAENWLMKKKIPLDSKWQIDIIAIEVNEGERKAKIRHFKNPISY